MKYAILSDIHGNTIALDAVLNELSGVDAYLLLGDYCAIGADPLGVLERITKLPNAYFVKGNTDHYICNNYADYPSPKLDEALHDAEKINTLAEMSRDFSWTQGMITAGGYFDWLAALPTENRVRLPDDSKLLLVHAAPRQFDGNGLLPINSDEDLAERFVCEEDLVLVGHTHWPQERRVNGKHIVNPGSVGNPIGGEVVARYATLEADEKSYDLQFHQTTYDIEAVLAQIDSAHHPASDYIRRFYKGEMIPHWYKA